MQETCRSISAFIASVNVRLATLVKCSEIRPKHKLAQSLLTLSSNGSTEQVALHLSQILCSPLYPPRLFQPSVDKKRNANTHDRPNCELPRVNHQRDTIHLKASDNSQDCAHSNLSLQIFETSTLKSLVNTLLPPYLPLRGLMNKSNDNPPRLQLCLIPNTTTITSFQIPDSSLALVKNAYLYILYSGNTYKMCLLFTIVVPALHPSIRKTGVRFSPFPWRQNNPTIQ